MTAYNRARSKSKSTRRKSKNYSNRTRRIKSGRIKTRSRRGTKIFKRGRGNYNTATVKRRRNPPTRLSGRGILSHVKKLATFAAKNAPTILRGARYLAKKSGNKTVSNIANSKLLDVAAKNVSKRFGGRGGALKPTAVKRQAKSVVNKLIKLYGAQGAQKILRAYLNTLGRGPVGSVIASVLGSILPF